MQGSVIYNPLPLQLLQKLADIRTNFARVGIPKLRLQFRDNLAESPLPIAALENLPPCPLQLDRAFGKQYYALFAGLVLGAPAASGCQARLAGILRGRHG
jgi:hypothetical protein